MDPVKVRPFRPYEKRELRRLKRQRSNAVNSHRARVLLLSRGGIPNKEIAGRVGFSPQWVRVLIHRFNTDGLCGILWYPWLHANHRPRRFLTEVKEQIADVALSSPKALIGMTRWSLAKLRDYLVEQDIVPSLSLEWLRTLLRRLGIRWRRTKTWKESTDPDRDAKLARIEYVTEHFPDRVFAFDEFGPLSIRPHAGTGWAPRGRPRRLPANYHKTHGVRQFHGCYSVGEDTIWGVVRRGKSAANTLAALRSIRAARPDGAPIYIILDNLSAHKGAAIRGWAARNKVELCFTPTYASWANPIEAHFGPLRTFVVANSDRPNHTMLARALHDYLRWRNANARHPDVLAAQRRERAKIRSERQHRWGQPRTRAA
jgi:transposase